MYVLKRCTVTSISSLSIADPELSSLPPPALLFLPSADNSGHDNDTESISEPASGCSNLSLSLPLRVRSRPQCPTALTASSSHRVGRNNSHIFQIRNDVFSSMTSMTTSGCLNGFISLLPIFLCFFFFPLVFHSADLFHHYNRHIFFRTQTLSKQT